MTDNAIELVTAILGSTLLAAVVPKVIDGIKSLRSGRALEEKEKNRSALSRLADAEERAELEAWFRRELQEYASVLRRMLVQLGVPEDKLPPWPQRKVKP